MIFDLFKEKNQEIAGLMFAHIIGFVDGFKIPGVSRICLAETYILAEWLQFASVISACEGSTERTVQILETFGQEEEDQKKIDRRKKKEEEDLRRRQISSRATFRQKIRQISSRATFKSQLLTQD